MTVTSKGWRRSALLFSIAALVSFTANLAFTAWATAQAGLDGNGIGVLIEGSCSHVRTLNTGVHVLINGLSSVLLAGSNYCMQCVSAPTRSQVTRAHQRRTWLDIGVPSMRNLMSVSRKSQVLWVLLVISSLPLHLL